MKRSIWTMVGLVLAAVMLWSGLAPASLSSPTAARPALERAGSLRQHLALRRLAGAKLTKRTTLGGGLLQTADTTHPSGSMHPMENLATNATSTGRLAWPSDWIDYYRLSLTAGQILNVHLIASSSSDPDAFFYNPSKSQINRSDRFSSDGEQFIQEITATGPHYLGLECYVGSGKYEVRPQVTADDTDTDALPFSRGYVSARLGQGGDGKDSYTLDMTDAAGDNRRVVYVGPTAGSTLQPHISVSTAAGGTEDPDITEGSWEGIDFSAGPGEGGLFTVNVTPTALTSGAYELQVLYTSDITGTSSHAPKTIIYGQRVPFTGHVNYSGPYDHARTEVDVYRQGSWTSMGYGLLSTSDNYSISAKPTAIGDYFALWLGDSDHDIWSTDTRHIVVKAKVTMGASSYRVRRGRSVRFSGRVYPRHRGTVYIQKKVGTRYRIVGRAALTSRSTWAWRTYPKRSGRWRAMYKGDASHARGYSASRYVRVY